MSYDHESDSFMSTQLDFSKKEYAHSSLRYTRLLPLSGTSTITITPGSTSETLIEIPTKCFNFAESFFCYNLDFATPLAANTQYVLPTDMVSNIQQIQALTRSGVVLADIPYVKNHTGTIRLLKTPMQEYLTHDIGELLAPVCRAGIANVTGGAAITAGQDVARSQTATWALSRFGTAATFGSTLTDTALEPLHQVIGTAQTADAPTLQVTLPFSALKNSLFAYNKLLYFPEVIVLRILWAPGQNAAWTSTGGGQNDPHTGAAVLANNITVTGISVYLAVEQDMMVATNLIERVNSGTFSALIPFTYMYKQSAAGSGNISIRINRGYGSLLKEIVWSVWNGTETGDTLVDVQNGSAGGGGSKVTSYYTMLDQNRLQDVNVNTVVQAVGPGGSMTNEDWMLNRKFLKGSVIASLDQYRYKWMHIDDFADQRMDAIAPSGLKDNLIVGLPLTVERKWDLTCTAGLAGPFFFYVSYCALKLLSIGAMGITCS